MIDIALNKDHDLVFDRDLVITSGIERIAQHVKITLLTFYQEWFLDDRVGIPYQELVLIKNPRMSILYSIFKNAIMTVSGVKSVRNLNIRIEHDTRVLRLSCQIITDEGIVKFTDNFKVAK